MDYQIEFERLLEVARQALSGVVIEKREVIGFAGLAVLEDVVKDYENRLTQHALGGWYWSPSAGIFLACNFILSAVLVLASRQ